MGLRELDEVLSQAHSVFVDTNVFIYHLGTHADYGPLAAEILEWIETGQGTGLTTVVALAELLVLPAKSGNMDAVLNYETYLLNFPNLQVVPIDNVVAREGALIRAATGLPTPDAFQLAAAIVHGADLIITNDKRWRERPQYPRILQLSSIPG